VRREPTGRLIEVGEVCEVFGGFEKRRIPERGKDVGRVRRGGFGNGGKSSGHRMVLQEGEGRRGGLSDGNKANRGMVGRGGE
jgi:hypothetical protein